MSPSSSAKQPINRPRLRFDMFVRGTAPTLCFLSQLCTCRSRTCRVASAFKPGDIRFFSCWARSNRSWRAHGPVRLGAHGACSGACGCRSWVSDTRRGRPRVLLSPGASPAAITRSMHWHKGVWLDGHTVATTLTSVFFTLHLKYSFLNAKRKYRTIKRERLPSRFLAKPTRHLRPAAPRFRLSEIRSPRASSSRC